MFHLIKIKKKLSALILSVFLSGVCLCQNIEIGATSYTIGTNVIKDSVKIKVINDSVLTIKTTQDSLAFKVLYWKQVDSTKIKFKLYSQDINEIFLGTINSQFSYDENRLVRVLNIEDLMFVYDIKIIASDIKRVGKHK